MLLCRLLFLSQECSGEGGNEALYLSIASRQNVVSKPSTTAARGLKYYIDFPPRRSLLRHQPRFPSTGRRAAPATRGRSGVLRVDQLQVSADKHTQLLHLEGEHVVDVAVAGHTGGQGAAAAATAAAATAAAVEVGAGCGRADVKAWKQRWMQFFGTSERDLVGD